jgi:ketosteroid isomerase-like protein
MAVVHQWRASFNSEDFKTGNSLCADEVVVIDDFAPHVRQGPAACSRWYKDFEAFAAKATITRANIVVEKATHLEFESGYAYLVAPGTLSFSRSGKPVTEAGVITMSLHKKPAGTITGWAWAHQ